MLKKHKNKIIVVGLLLLGVFLILFSTLKSKLNTKTDTEFSCEEYTKDLEKKIEGFLLSVDGIHNVKVIITLDSSAEKLFASNDTSLSLIGDSKEDQNASMEIYPYVRGVAVSCTNGESDYVKNKVTRLLSAYLGIPSNRIEIVSYG